MSYLLDPNNCPNRVNHWHDKGWPGITREECDARGGCFDPSSPSNWCYSRNAAVIPGAPPRARVLHRWPPVLVPTASNFYGPLLCLGLDNIYVRFPDGWGSMFMRVLEETNTQLENMGLGRLSFKNLSEFQEYIRDRFRRDGEFGNTSFLRYLQRCDNPNELHLPGATQDRILDNIDRNISISVFLQNLVRKWRHEFSGIVTTAFYEPDHEGSGPISSLGHAGWVCPRCTLNNPSNPQECDACGGPRYRGGHRIRKTLKYKKRRLAKLKKKSRRHI